MNHLSKGTVVECGYAKTTSEKIKVDKKKITVEEAKDDFYTVLILTCIWNST